MDKEPKGWRLWLAKQWFSPASTCSASQSGTLTFLWSVHTLGSSRDKTLGWALCLGAGETWLLSSAISLVAEVGSKGKSNKEHQAALRFCSCLKVVSELAFSGPQTIKINIIRNRNDKSLCKRVTVYKVLAHVVHCLKLKAQGWGDFLCLNMSLRLKIRLKNLISSRIFIQENSSPLWWLWYHSYHLSILAWNS